jgi:tRNA(adenine34) deaminase
MEPLSIFSDDHFMREALKQARLAFDDEEVPIGAVVVHGTRVIGRGHNQVERLHDPTAHAEMIAITAACQHMGSKYLEGCTLFVTIEPCPMCAGALKWAQLDRVVYGANEPKHGFSLHGNLLHPRTELVGGVLATDCADIMKEFFRARRGKP